MHPAPEPFIRECLGRMAVLCRAREEGQAVWNMRAAEYARLLSHYPADIWQDAMDEHVRTSPFFPAIADLEKLMRPRLQERQRQIARLRKMREARADEAQADDYRTLPPDEKARLDALIAETYRNLAGATPQAAE